MPWEIFRSTRLLPDTDRGITVVTKAGGLQAYYSHLVLVPEYELGFTILVAGDVEAFQWLDNELTTNVVNRFEKIARMQTSEKYAGLYNSATLNSSITLEVEGGSGLVAKTWISNGTDFLVEYTYLKTGKRDISQGRVQLVPMRIFKGNGGELWRATFVPATMEPKGVIDGCMINDVDSLMYGERSIQEFEFIFDKHGKVSAVDIPAFRVTLQKEMPDTPLLSGLGNWRWLQKPLQEKSSLSIGEL